MKVLINIVTLAILQFTSPLTWAQSHGPLEQYLNSLSKIDPNKTSDPGRFKASRDIAIQFAECLKNKSINSESLQKIACASLMEAKLSKLNQELKAIGEKDFVQEVQKKAFHNLAETYSQITDTYKEPNEVTNDDLCKGLSFSVNLGANCTKSQETEVANLKKELAKNPKKTFMDLESLTLDYNSKMLQFLSDKSYLARCEKNKKLLAEARSKPESIKKLQELNVELAQLVRSENISNLKLRSHPITLLLEDDFELENDLIANVDPLSTPFKEKREQIRQEIRFRAAELLGKGSNLNRLDEVVVTYGTKDEVKDLDFFIKNYPVATGQMLSRYPHMISKVCSKLAAKGANSRIRGVTWGDSILGTEVMDRGFMSGIISFAPTKEKEVLSFLAEDKTGCESITSYYEKIKRTATIAEVNEKDVEFNNAFRVLGQKISSSGITGMLVQLGLKTAQNCKGPHFNAFVIDMKNNAIGLAKKINDDPELPALLNAYGRKMAQSENDSTEFPTSSKLNLLMAYLARLPESKTTSETDTQNELIERIRSGLKGKGEFDINKLVNLGDMYCVM
ncbi:MAG: hypothetical protein SGJ18_12625 [Pseudomonadota bacterium]|nr:hypothetical protein [Pseudomonadota bacterium]